MGLTNKKEEQLKKMPNIQSQITKSKDGKYLIHKTIITDVKPVEYYNVVIEASGSEEMSDEQKTLTKEKAKA